MTRTHHVLALVTLLVGLAHSCEWDIALAGDNMLALLYKNGTGACFEGIGIESDFEHLTYDIVHNRMILVDGKKTQDTLIITYNFATRKKLPLVKRNLNDRFLSSVLSLAYDPVTEILFWSDAYAIYWFSLKPGFTNNVYGNRLFSFSKYRPTSVAVDSCKGYIYWIKSESGGPSKIEKARFDGSDREIVIEENLHDGRNLVIDQQTQKMYWTEDTTKIKPTQFIQDKQYSFQSADLNGENRTTFYTTRNFHPRTLITSKDFIYWVYNFDLDYSLWQLPKNPTEDTRPQGISVRGTIPFHYSIAAKYKIEDQIQDIQDCEPLRSLLPKNQGTDE
ncbi:hypothetical protein PYW07_013758 [Mythimna separata]|uniref:Uncharacterized protein n=1 Tax=Mythimna separata TaxID=271217 RepID=A0AAD8DP71_MYTSE|nr:hypothetical protein PYW07_013758 [Mythimna separata]